MTESSQRAFSHIDQQGLIAKLSQTYKHGTRPQRSSGPSYMGQGSNVAAGIKISI